MREDMFKVIVERPRIGCGARFKKRVRFSDKDELPAAIGMKRHAALMYRERKMLNENLKPLKRYLGRQIGRPWNKVYSEISATLSPGHTVKEHVRAHIGDFVLYTIGIGRDGTWLDASRRSFGDRSLPWRQPFYVDPKDGLLKDSAKLWKKLAIAVTRWRWRKPQPDLDIRKLDAASDLRRVDGIWYEITYARIKDALPETTVFDLIKRMRVSARTRHAARKRQLSASELQHYGLSNELKD